MHLSTFDYKIEYQKGSTNIEADVLSQSTVSENIPHYIPLFDLNKIKEVQNKVQPLVIKNLLK